MQLLHKGQGPRLVIARPLDPICASAMKYEVNVCFAASALVQQPTLLTQLQQLVAFHLFTALAALAKGAVVAEDVVQGCTRIVPVLAHRELETDSAEIVQNELVLINDAIMVEVCFLKLSTDVLLNPLLALHAQHHVSCESKDPSNSARLCIQVAHIGWHLVSASPM